VGLSATVLRSLRRVAGGLVAAGALLCAGQACAAPALWAVKDKDSTIYLFGTMHLLPDAAEWKTPGYEKAYADAQAVWFETDVDVDRAALQQEIMKRVFTADPLSKRIPPDAKARVVKAIDPRLGVTEQVAEGMRPWYLAMLIMGSSYAQSGFKAEAGFESRVSEEAGKAGKPRRYFETMGQQLDVFAGLSPEAETQLLMDALASLDGDAPKADAVAAVWMGGSEKTMEADYIDEVKRSRPEVYKALIVDRNRAWADAISREMQGSGVELVNVGAAHLVGDEGLPALLRARGYEVERVQ
jgi:hypothetical protein